MSDPLLFINDLFWTIQGEGSNAGRRALFVRMPYCNLSCSWCDTNFSTHTIIPVSYFVEFAQMEPSRFAVITGGEPLMHRHTPIVAKVLKDLGFEIAVETNGTFPSVDGIDFITCSPKAQSMFRIDPALYDKVSEFKYVVDDAFSFDTLIRHDNDPETMRHSLSPEFTNMASNVERITTYIQKNPRWRLNLQTHKWIGIP
jgi:organic radical activating enzyme